MDNKIDQFCTRIVKEEENHEEHGLKCEQEIKRLLNRSKEKMEVCGKDLKEAAAAEKRAKAKVEEELERRSQRPPFTGPDAARDRGNYAKMHNFCGEFVAKTIPQNAYLHRHTIEPQKTKIF